MRRLRLGADEKGPPGKAKMNDAQQTFDAMSIIERQNLAKLNFWLNLDRWRRRGEHLIGPEYAALRRHGVIGYRDPSLTYGKGLMITALGRDVLYYIDGPYVP